MRFSVAVAGVLPSGCVFCSVMVVPICITTPIIAATGGWWCWSCLWWIYVRMCIRFSCTRKALFGGTIIICLLWREISMKLTTLAKCEKTNVWSTSTHFLRWCDAQRIHFWILAFKLRIRGALVLHTRASTTSTNFFWRREISTELFTAAALR